MEPCAGVRLDRRLRRDRLAGGSRRIELEGACGAAGAWLRELHRTPFPEVTSVGVAGDPLGALSERAQEGLRRCRESGEIPMPPREGPDPEGDRLRRLARSCGVASSRPVLSHGDYWPGNVFVDDDRVQAIDLEGHGPAAAVEDLAYFTVHLELFFALPLLRRRGERLSRAFLEGYLAGDPLDRPAYRLARDAVALELLAASREGGSGLGDGTSGRLGRRHRSHLRSLLGSA